jgi:hypothetical protein
MEEEPLFKTKTGNEDMNKNLSRCQLNESATYRLSKRVIGVAATANLGLRTIVAVLGRAAQS